jgi:hypothetical protein
MAPLFARRRLLLRPGKKYGKILLFFAKTSVWLILLD